MQVPKVVYRSHTYDTVPVWVTAPSIASHHAGGLIVPCAVISVTPVLLVMMQFGAARRPLAGDVPLQPGRLSSLNVECLFQS